MRFSGALQSGEKNRDGHRSLRQHLALTPELFSFFEPCFLPNSREAFYESFLDTPQFDLMYSNIWLSRRTSSCLSDARYKLKRKVANDTRILSYKEKEGDKQTIDQTLQTKYGKSLEDLYCLVATLWTTRYKISPNIWIDVTSWNRNKSYALVTVQAHDIATLKSALSKFHSFALFPAPSKIFAFLATIPRFSFEKIAGLSEQELILVRTATVETDNKIHALLQSPPFASEVEDNSDGETSDEEGDDF